jgi:hypothetical protein
MNIHYDWETSVQLATAISIAYFLNIIVNPFVLYSQYYNLAIEIYQIDIFEEQDYYHQIRIVWDILLWNMNH